MQTAEVIRQADSNINKSYLRLTPSELLIIRYVAVAGHLSSTEMSSLLMKEENFKYLFDPKIFRRLIRRLIKKGILDLYKKDNSLRYQLTSYGRTLWQYILPYSLKNKHFTPSFASLHKAATELGLDEEKAKKKRYGFLHYFVISKKLYLIKNVYTNEIRREISSFPLIPKDKIGFLLRFIPPDFLKSKIFKRILKETLTASGWSWNTIFNYCMAVGRHYPSKIVTETFQPVNKQNKNIKGGLL